MLFKKILPFGHFETFGEAPAFPFSRLLQVHGVKVRRPSMGEPLEGDAWVASSENSIPLAILTADCMPIVVLGKKGNAFIHAGWRGLQGEILAVPEVQEIVPYYAFVGPHIQKCCYEVSSEFKKEFPQGPGFYQNLGKLTFQLSEALRFQLTKIYPQLELEVAEECTCCNNAFHSFRRNKAVKRNFNIFFPS